MKTSVVIITKNEAKYFARCLDALLNQTISAFEIIIVDNGSIDKTRDIIRSYDSQKIKYYFEPSECGIAELRNVGVKMTKGDFIFFTDGDCVPGIHWIEDGMRALENGEYIGVTGRTYYESPQKVTISDYDTNQLYDGEFMTCNVAYRRDAIEKAGYFDPHFKYGLEDRDLAMRILKLGKIYFSHDMIVAHQKKKFTPQTIFQRARRAEGMVYLISKYGWNENNKYGYQQRTRIRIIYPIKLLTIFFPPIMLLNERYATLNDLLIGFFKYLSYIYERVLIWKAAVKYKVFVI